MAEDSDNVQRDGETEEKPEAHEPLLNGRYKLLRPLGQGGMGTVYLAEHIRLDTIVAVKEVHAEQGSEEEAQAALAQCEREARTLVRLHHPNLPNVTDAFIEGERFYLVMEYIDGVTLETKLKEANGNPIDPNLVVEWALQVADVLSYLHAQEPPIVFRDLKPANIMVQPNGNVRLIDFGIARRFQPGANKDTALLGSVGYSPPEQFGRHQTDPRSDIYAFGATLHHLLTGLDPAASPFKFKAAREVNPAVPLSLSNLIAHCVLLDADARPQDVHTLAMHLLAIRDELANAPLLLDGSPAAIETLGAGGSATRIPSQSLPVGNSGSVSLPALPSASTGPRIISTKLTEAEAEKRRMGSREMASIPSVAVLSPQPASASAGLPSGGVSGRVASPTAMSANGGAARRWLGIAAVVVVLGGGSIVLNHSLHSKATPPVKRQPTTTTTVPTSSGPTPNSGSGTQAATNSAENVAPPTLNSGGEQPPPDSDHPVELHAEAQGVEVDAQNNPVLRIMTSGKISGPVTGSTRVAAFFYDGDDRPIPAADVHGIYANSDGQTSIAHSLTPNPDDGTFQTPLLIPLAAFPPAALNGQIKFRCAVFMDLQRAGDTDMLLIPFALTPAGNSGARANPVNRSGNGSGGILTTPRGIGGP